MPMPGAGEGEVAKNLKILGKHIFSEYQVRICNKYIWNTDKKCTLAYSVIYLNIVHVVNIH